MTTDPALLWQIFWEYFPFWIKGLAYTVALTAVSCSLGTVISIPFAAGLLSGNRLVRWLTTSIVELCKAVPLPALLVHIYYVFPISPGIPIPAFWSASVAFTLNLAGFLSDVLRGCYSAIPKGHVEAAVAVGMTRGQIQRRVILPETFRRAIPTVFSYYVAYLKLSTLASIIGVPELMYAARMVNIETVKPAATYTLLTLISIALVLPISAIGRVCEGHRWFSLYPRTR